MSLLGSFCVHSLTLLKYFYSSAATKATATEPIFLGKLRGVTALSVEGHLVMIHFFFGINL